ncbi:restriction endonuclease subunit S [Pectobacterium brasiliense]|uniref:restriction endonuclease subunit S n=1 Tax=Pectobacterium brasiliense TaxID=180957 RepID=UPI00069493BA|nr:restriction endonuclease subunit S [Pectobacterium brasiliense]
MSWPMVEIGSVVSALSGFAWKSSNYTSMKKDAMPIIRIQNVGEYNTPQDFVYWDEQYDNKYVVSSGDILVSLSGNIKVGIWEEPDALLNQRIVKLIPGDKIDKDYLYYSVLKNLNDISNLGKKAVISNVSVNDLKKIVIPLPPLPVQRKISMNFKKTDLLKRQSEKMSSELNALAQAVYEFNVGISAKENSNWSSYTISDLCDTSKSSMRTGPFGSDLKHSEFVSSGVAVIGIDNAVSNEFRWVERRFITKQKYEKLKRYTVHPHDVIITIMGTTGRVAVIPADIPLAISTKHLAVLTLDKNKANPHFIADTLKWNSHVIEQIKRSNKGAIMDGLNLGTIKSLAVVLPPKEIQDEYVLKAKAIQDRIAETKELSLSLELQFNALMQRAFSGKLNPKKVA